MPRFTIYDVNDAYLAATMRTREEFVGRGIFEAFSDNPGEATSAGVSTLRASLDRVLASRRPDKLPRLKYDIARPDGKFEERWWGPVNSPVLGFDGEVEAIIHDVTDVTQECRAEAAQRESEHILHANYPTLGQLQTISRVFIAEEKPQALYDEIMDAALRGMDSDAASLQVLDPATDQLHLLAYRGFHPDSAALWNRVSSSTGSTCGTALKAGEPLVVKDVEDPEAHIRSTSLHHYRLCGIASVQSTPLVARDGRIVGMFSTHRFYKHEPSELDFARIDDVVLLDR